MMITIFVTSLLQQELLQQEKGFISTLTVSDILTFLAVSGIGGALAYVIKSWVDKRSIDAVAKKEEATAADIVAGAAAELINPLRLELQTTREELIQVRKQLNEVTLEMHSVNHMLAKQSKRNEHLEARNTELERKNAECEEKLASNQE